MLFTSGCSGATNQSDPNTFPSIPEDATIYRENWLATCGEYRIAFDARDRLTEEERATVRSTGLQAIALWNQALGFELFREVADDKCLPKDINIRQVETQGALATAVYGPGLFSGSWCGCAIFVDPQAISSYKVVAHELGHCLGLSHSKNPGSLMYKFAENGELSKEVVELVASRIDHGLFGNQQVFRPDCASPIPQ